jgi:hypothetical protein
MTNTALGGLLARLLEDMEGGNGFWHGDRHEVPIYVVADEEHDRMRIMAPIGELRHPDPDFLCLLLQANFDRALDAKYALRRRELWSVFMHPLSTLVPDDLGTYLDQVARLVKNTGSTYASSELVYGEEEDERIEFGSEEDFEDDDEEDSGDAAEGDDDAEDGEPFQLTMIEESLEDDLDDEEFEIEFEDDDEEEGQAGSGPR